MNSRRRMTALERSECGILVAETRHEHNMFGGGRGPFRVKLGSGEPFAESLLYPA
jgi:hypothetical protein